MRVAIGSDERSHLTKTIVKDVKRLGHSVEVLGRLQTVKNIGLQWRSRLLVGLRRVM